MRSKSLGVLYTLKLDTPPRNWELGNLKDNWTTGRDRRDGNRQRTRMIGTGDGVDAGNACARSTSPPQHLSPTPKLDADGNSSGSAKPSKDKKKRVVSFAENVQTQDGSRVIVTEEHGTFLSPLLGKIVMSADSCSSASQASLSSINSDHLDDASHTSTSSGPLVAFASDVTTEKLAESDSSTGLVKRGPPSEGESSESEVRYENMIVKMGLLKCGSRYQVSVPIPQYWRGESEARVVEGSLDEDLTGEITPGTDADGKGHTVTIKLGARKRGPYRGRLLLELTSRPPQAGRDDSHPSTGARQSLSTPSPADRVLMSLQIDATFMGDDLGTPKLRNGVSCLGRIVGYDSDDDTDWQGFDGD